MAIGAWRVLSVVEFTGNGSAFMSRLAASTMYANAQFDRQKGKISANELAMARYNKKLEESRARLNQFATMAAAVGFSIGLAVIAKGVNDAAKFERAMTGVQIATAATGKVFAALKLQAIDVSGVTAQSAVTIAQEMQAASQGAFHRPKDLMALFPMMAKFADVRYMASGGTEDPVNTVDKMTQFAHLFQAYGVDGMRKMLDNGAKLMMVTKVGFNQLVTQGRMFIPNAVKMGVSEDTLFQYMAIMAQNGFMQGRGGTALNNMILNAMAVTPTSHLSKAKVAGLAELQMRLPDGSLKFLTKDGNINLVQMIDHLRAMRELMEKGNPRLGQANWMKDIGAVFGKEAQRLVSLLADGTTQKQINRNKEYWDKIPGVEGQWYKYQNDFFYQFNTLKTNLENLLMVTFLPTLPILTKFFFDLNSKLGPTVHMIAAHPNLGLTIAGWITGITAAFGIRTVAGVLGGIASMRNALDALAGTAARDAAIIDASAAGAAAGGVGGFLGRAKGFGVGALRFVDGLFLGGLGEKLVIPAMRGFWKIATKSVGTAFDASGAAIRGAFQLVFRRFFQHLASLPKEYTDALIKDMKKGLDGAFDLIFRGPLQKLLTTFSNVAPRLSSFVDVIIGQIGKLAPFFERFGGALAKFLLAIPGLDIAGLVLTPTSAAGGDLSAAQLRLEQERNRDHQIRIEGGVHFHINHTDEHAARQQFESWLNTYGVRPSTMKSRGGQHFTSPFLANPAAVSP